MKKRTTARRIALPLAALCAGAVLSGCGEVGRGDVAAVVNGVDIPETQVREALSQLASNPGYSKVSAFDVTQMLAYGQIAQPIAEKHGVALSDDDIKKLGGEKVAGIGPEGLEVLRINQMIGAQMGQGATQTSAFAKEFLPAVKAASIDVNPRFGKVDRGDDGSQLMAQDVIPWIKADSLADKAATGQE